MEDEQAEEVLARMERMALANKHGGAEDEQDDEDEDAELMAIDLMDSPVRLAENGYELLVTRDDGTVRRIGPRDLRRFYKQRHRPSDLREMVVAANSENKERGIMPIHAERGVFVKGAQRLPMHITIMQKKAEKAARKYMGNQMIMGSSANKKFDLNGQNVKTKLPKACPY